MSTDKRFSDVRSSIDTGASLRKFPKSVANARKDEIFQRMKVSTLVTLMLQMAQLELEESILLAAVEKENEGATLDDTVQQRLDKEGIKTTDYATLQSVIRGVGELDFQDTQKKEKATEILSMKKPVGTTCPYLLLDVRSEDDFKQSHIITAVSYPHTMLSRAINYEIREMSAYKNQPGKMIVLYDTEEVQSTKAASTLVQRGYDNIYLLSGGLKNAFKRYPQCLVVGVVPKSIISPKLTVRSSRALKSAMSRSSSLPCAMTKKAVKANPTGVSKNGNSEMSDKLSQQDLITLRNQLETNMAPEMSRSLSSKNTITYGSLE